MKKVISLFCMLLTVVMMFSACGGGSDSNAEADPSVLYQAIEKAYGSDFPLKDGDNMLPEEVGLSEDLYEGARGVQVTTSTEKYVVYIVLANSADDAKTVEDTLNTYITNESNSMNSYLSDTGKKLFKNAVVASKGRNAYLIMLDTDGNTKAIDAIDAAL